MTKRIETVARYATPRPMIPQKLTTRNRPGLRGKACSGGCGHKFGKNETVIIQATQVSPFRGDDIEDVYCAECWKERTR